MIRFETMLWFLVYQHFQVERILNEIGFYGNGGLTGLSGKNIGPILETICSMSDELYFRLNFVSY
jgi:hypothetical protein